jgi:hypothetical protein
VKIVVTKESRVFCTHTDNQDVAGLYPEFLVLTVPDGATVEPGQTWEVGLDAAKAARIAEATAVCDAILAPFGREYGVWETATFDQQYAEAVAYTANPAAPVPLLSAMCAARGISVATLAGKIIANRLAWVGLTGYVIGQRQRIVGLIEAATSVTDVLAVDMTISLPG